ncbi:YDG domain-containing protein [Janthinobacterium fluminis]|uniref:YDG domain-containing protein n=1 Tax=Janthinobacterium fluminis TaxID=2987524 RepID=A0ABT5JTW2_9BURK|nr:YDG domain-containing protein [Janthinobacterium fluminis]MDC8756174.1 YDG domain-containing protein [Janthinobacterium fluminis]
MNRIYRSIWSRRAGTFVAVSELVKSAGKRALPGAGGTRPALKALAAALLLAFGAPALALPTGASVAAGAATVASGAGKLTVTQGSQNAVLNWSSFNIGQGEAVQFVQPNANAVALNRVLGAQPSSILGSLSANGKVFLVNPNGILFGKGASVNVGGLAASTLGIADADFMAGRYRFGNAGAGAVLNQGSISAPGGYVALLGAQVTNEGTINARLGSVALAAGNAVTLDVAGDGLLNVAVNQGALRALVQNGGLIQADGGQVLLSAQAAGTLLQTAVNNTGVIEAHTIQNRNGSIKLLGDMQSGTVKLAGRLDAGAPDGGNGGFVETSAAHVQIAADARVTTAAGHGLAGTWLVDPSDFTIAASGGDMTGATLSSNLAGGNVTILSTSGGSGTAGNVNVNDTVAWSANTLTLNAQNNININTAMNGSGSASLALKYGQAAVAAGNGSTVNVAAPVNLPSGAHFSTQLGSNGATVNYTVINSLGAAGSASGTDLQGMAGGLAGNYALGSNIDARATSAWNSNAGFAPVGSAGSPFTGKFDGLGHVITGLASNRMDADVGLFGSIGSAGVVRNLGLEGGSMAGGSATYGSAFGIGGLAGRNLGSVDKVYNTGTVSAAGGYGNGAGLVGNNDGSISNSYATGAISGSAYASIGGLAGKNTGTITYSYATGNVSSSDGYAGGLVLSNAGGIIDHSFATGNVAASSYGGGLASGNNSGGTIRYSHATGTVTGNNGTGGLVGSNADAGTSILNSYATGAVTATGTFIGGLVGISNQATISNSYATGNVTGVNTVGGLVGYNIGTVSNSYAAGLVTGTTRFGAVLGDNYNGTITTSYFNSTVNGATAGIGFAQAGHFTGTTGLTTTQMKTAANFVGFTFTTTPGAAGNNWVLVDVDGTLNNAGATLGAAYPMLSSEYSTNITGAHQLQLMAMNLAGTFTLGRSFSAAKTAGTSDVWHGSSFIPVGRFAGQFSGSLDGKGYVVSGLNINLAATDNVGLFGVVGAGGSVSNVGLEGGSITGRNNVGGIAGRNAGTIRSSFVASPLSGNGNVGGLVGYNTGTVADTYASGTVAGTAQVGGLVGQNYAGSVSTSYATGAATGASGVGGLVGLNYAGSVSTSFWDLTTSGRASSSGGLGMATANMQTLANFNSATSANGSANPNWNLTSVWALYDGHSYPLLRAFMTPLTVTANNASKTYDGAAYSGGNGVRYSRVTDGNLLGAATYGGSSQGAVNAGTYAITPGGFYSTGQHGYLIAYENGTLTVDPAALTVLNVTGTVVANKVYDGTTAAALSMGVLQGVLGGDVGLVSLIESGFFASKNVGNNIAVTATDTLSGAAAGNYTLVQPTGLTANITPATISSVSGITAGNKVYDGLTAAVLSSGAAVFNGMVAGDSLSVTGASGVFADKNAGAGKSVGISGITLAGIDAGNYILSSGAASATATITPKALTLTGMAAGNKVYDGTDLAGLSGGALSGLVGTETLGFSGQTGHFSDKNVANGKAVTVTGVVLADAGFGATAGLAGNYTVANPTGLTASVTPAAISGVTGLGANNKVYDGGTGAVLVTGGAVFNGMVAGDSLSLTGASGVFADKNAGAGKTVNVSGIVLAGTDAGNYTLTSGSGSATADITPKALTVTGVTAGGKVYDGTATASLSGGTLSGLVGTETLTLAGLSGIFADKNAGVGKTVAVSGAALVDAGTGPTAGLAANYTVASPAGLTATITQATISSVTGLGADNKVYDGGTGAVLATGGAVFNGMVAGDSLSLTGASGVFADKNAGTGKTVNVSGIVLAGTDAGNYTLTSGSGSATADITPKALTVTGMTASGKVYDGTATASLSGGTLSGLVGTETLALSGMVGSFADKHAGVGKAVTVSGAALADAGSDATAGLASNYTVGNPAALTATITPATISAVGGLGAASKVYDGGTGAVLSTAGAIFGGMLAGDSLAVGSASGAFSDKNAGVGKTVGIGGITLAGADAGNYTLASTVATATADISAATLLVAATAANKVYDGNSNAVVSLGDNRIAGDVLTLSSGGASFADKNAGTGKAVTVTGIGVSGADAGNYIVNATATATADITPAALTVTANNATKASGQPNPLFGATYSALQPGDTLASALTGTLGFATPATTTSAAGDYRITPSGQQAGNYVLTYVDGVLSVTGASAPAALPNVLASAIAMTAVAPSQGNMVGQNQLLTLDAPAAAPATSRKTSSDETAPAVQTLGSVVTNMLPGLNLTVIDLGLKLPATGRGNDKGAAQ